MLLGQQLDARLRLEEQWGELRGFLADILDWAGVRAIEAEELTLLPGLEEILALTDLVTHARLGGVGRRRRRLRADGRDAAAAVAAGDPVWWMDRLFPITRQMTSFVGPVVRGLTAVPVADEPVFGSVERLYLRLAGRA